jgi:hypothetical protein
MKDARFSTHHSPRVLDLFERSPKVVVPEGPPKVARRFIAGDGPRFEPVVPEGRLKGPPRLQSSLRDFPTEIVPLSGR